MPEEIKEKIVTAKAISKPSYDERGKSGLKTSGGWIYEEFLPKLQWPRAGAIYQEMSSNDPVITAILLCSRQLIRNASWYVKPASTLPADLQAAAFLRECMDDMSITWSDFIDDIISFFEYGFSYEEIIYKKRNGSSSDSSKRSKYDDNRIGWRKFAGRAQNTISHWEFDSDGGIRGAYQSTEDGDVFIPIEKALLFRTTAQKNNPEGKSFLRGAYRPWYFKKHIEEVEGIGIERDLAGLPVITAPEGVDLDDKDNPIAVQAKNAAMDLVSAIRRDRNEGVVLGHGWEIDLLSTGGSRQFDTSAIINRYDQRIAITLLSDIVMLGADKVGSFALAKVKQSLLAASLDAMMESTADVLNTYAVPRLFSFNTFTDLTDYPKILCSDVVAPDLKELGAYIKDLSGANMTIFPDVDLENYLRRSAKLPELTEEQEKARKEEAKKPKEEVPKTNSTTPTVKEEGGEEDA